MWRNANNDFGFLWEAGWNNVDSTEYEAEFRWSRYLNQRWTAFGGLRLTIGLSLGIVNCARRRALPGGPLGP